MLRMSKILSGINLKGINMNEKIENMINNKKIRSKIKSVESNIDDH